MTKSEFWFSMIRPRTSGRNVRSSVPLNSTVCTNLLLRFVLYGFKTENLSFSIRGLLFHRNFGDFFRYFRSLTKYYYCKSLLSNILNIVSRKIKPIIRQKNCQSTEYRYLMGLMRCQWACSRISSDSTENFRPGKPWENHESRSSTNRGFSIRGFLEKTSSCVLNLVL